MVYVFLDSKLQPAEIFQIHFFDKNPISLGAKAKTEKQIRTIQVRIQNRLEFVSLSDIKLINTNKKQTGMRENGRSRSPSLTPRNNTKPEDNYR